MELSVWDHPEDLSLAFTATCQDGKPLAGLSKCAELKIGDTVRIVCSLTLAFKFSLQTILSSFSLRGVKCQMNAVTSTLIQTYDLNLDFGKIIVSTFREHHHETSVERGKGGRTVNRSHSLAIFSGFASC